VNYWTKRDKQKELETNGVPVIVPAYPEWTFYVRPETPWSAAYQRAYARIAEQPAARDYLERIRAPGYVRTPADDAQDAENVRLVFADAAIAKWEGVTSQNGSQLTLTPSNARMLLQHFDDIYDHLQRAARNPALFEVPNVETIKGN